MAVKMCVPMLMPVFWVVMSCGVVGDYQHFRGKYHLHLQGETLITTCNTTQFYNEEDCY
jgi:hypothetical protein